MLLAFKLKLLEISELLLQNLEKGHAFLEILLRAAIEFGSEKIVAMLLTRGYFASCFVRTAIDQGNSAIVKLFLDYFGNEHVCTIFSIDLKYCSFRTCFQRHAK